MQIAVTGATGFLGRYIVRHLANGGHACRAWYRPSSDRGGFEDLARAPEWIAGGLGDRKAAEELVRGCHAVVHAALDRPGRGFRGSEGDLEEFCRVNILGTLALIDAAWRAGVERFIFISSCAVHERILDDRPLDETHPTWATSHYGAHKAAIEQFVYSFGLGEGRNICALRPCGIYGVERPPNESKWFSLVRSIVQGEPVVCRRGGKEVHAHDVARAVELLLSAEGIAGQAFSCCDRYISDYEVASLVKEQTGSKSAIEGGPTSPKHEIDNSKLRGLGFEFGGRARLAETLDELVGCIRGK